MNFVVAGLRVSNQNDLIGMLDRIQYQATDHYGSGVGRFSSQIKVYGGDRQQEANDEAHQVA